MSIENESHWPAPDPPTGYVDEHAPWDGCGPDPAGVLELLLPRSLDVDQ